MKLIKSTEAVLTHEDRYNLSMTYQELYDLRSILYLLRNSTSLVGEWYADVIDSIITTTDNHER